MSKKTRWILAIVVVVAVAAADLVIRYSGSASHLQVVQAENGQPIEGAEVFVPADEGGGWQRLGRTDAEGKLRVPPGEELRLRVVAEGWVPKTQRFVVPKGEQHTVRLQAQ
jgi:hypothetical protein